MEIGYLLFRRCTLSNYGDAELTNVDKQRR